MPYLYLTIAISAILVGWENLLSPMPVLGYETPIMDVSIIIGALSGVMLIFGGRFRVYALLIMAPVFFLLMSSIGLSKVFPMPLAVALSGIVFLYYVYGSSDFLRTFMYLLGVAFFWLAVVNFGSVTWWSILWMAIFFVVVELYRQYYLSNMKKS